MCAHGSWESFICNRTFTVRHTSTYATTPSCAFLVLSQRDWKAVLSQEDELLEEETNTVTRESVERGSSVLSQVGQLAGGI